MEWQLGNRSPHPQIRARDFISRISGEKPDVTEDKSQCEFSGGEQDLALATAELFERKPEEVLELLGDHVFDLGNLKTSYNPYLLKKPHSYRAIGDQIEIQAGTPDNLDRSWSPMVLTKGKDGLYWSTYQVLTGSTARNAFETAPIYNNFFRKAWEIIKNPSLLLLFFNYSVSSSIANAVVETARIAGFKFANMKIERWSGNRWCFHFGFAAPSDLESTRYNNAINELRALVD